MTDFSSIIDYQFTSPGLLKEALTHPSLSRSQQESKEGVKNYERLEFLGDSVLGLVISDLLIHAYPNENEGDLARRKAGLICREMLANIASDMELGKYLSMTSGEKNLGGKENAANLENALEAVIGALYLDGGIEVAKTFIQTYWGDAMQEMKAPPMDPKTALQEWAQALGKPLPKYVLLKQEGPSHSPIFTIEVRVEGEPPVQAQGTSKRMAERSAAEQMLESVQ